MTQEYRSKVEDAFKMVLDRIEKKLDDGGLGSASNTIYRMELATKSLHDYCSRENMKGQKQDSTEIAATAILYMVKFL